MKRYRLLVLVPVGPNLPVEFVLDTLASIRHFMRSDFKIIVIDDSGENVGAAISRFDADIDVIRNERTSKTRNVHGGLYVAVSGAMLYALQTYEFEMLLRFDTDALVIGAGSEDEASAFFEQNRHVGLIGSYRIASDGGKRSFSKAARRIVYELGFWHRFTDRHSIDSRSYFRTVLRTAVRRGYEYGEHCLAGSTFFSSACLQAMAEAGYLGREELRVVKLGDDQMFGMLVTAAGYKMADFASGTLPMGVRWRGLPFSPTELLRRKKKLIHSTKFWDTMTEAEIREYFRKDRELKTTL